jgi:hypothetical protein
MPGENGFTSSWHVYKNTFLRGGGVVRRGNLRIPRCLSYQGVRTNFSRLHLVRRWNGTTAGLDYLEVACTVRYKVLHWQWACVALSWLISTQSQHLSSTAKKPASSQLQETSTTQTQEKIMYVYCTRSYTTVMKPKINNIKKSGIKNVQRRQ